MKNSFIFYTDYMRHLELLNMEQRGVLITALSCYQLKTELPDMDAVTNMAFSFIAQDMDANDKKYAEKTEKAKKAAEARWNNAKPCKTVQENAKPCKRIERYSDDEGLNNAFTEYVEMRKKIKAPMTDRAVSLAKSKLTELSGGDTNKAIAILNQSTMNSWKGLFPLKEPAKKSNKFVNFNQRSYDPTDLEKKMLGVK